MTYTKEDYDKKHKNNYRYLTLLSNQYPTIADACIEIINLQAILNLPKGTEHFLSDIHGEYEPFVHVLKNASGVIKRKIQDIFGKSLRQEEIKSLATFAIDFYGDDDCNEFMPIIEDNKIYSDKEKPLF